MQVILYTGYYRSSWILYIMLHTSNFKPSCQMHFIAYSQQRSAVHFWLHSMVHFQPISLYAPKYSSELLSRALLNTQSRTLIFTSYGSLHACLTMCSLVGFQDSLKYTPELALRYTLNCSRWHTLNLLGSMLPSTLSRKPISLDYMLPCMMLYAQSRDLPSCTFQVPGGIRLVVYDWYWLAGSRQRVVCGRWKGPYVGQNEIVS
jgi:hypothetical protein